MSVLDLAENPLLIKSTIIAFKSPQKQKMTAHKVAVFKNISKAKLPSSEIFKNSLTKIRCPEEEMGKNSVKPWIKPRMMDSIMLIGYNHNMSEKLLLPVSIIIAGLLVGGGIYWNGKMAKENPTPVEQQKLASQDLAGTLREIDANDHILGDVNARVVIVEYSDTECPYCKVFHSAMLSIMQEYGKEGKVAWVYRHFPIAEIHSRAPKEAEAQECAGELGGNSKFWEYTNKLYEITPSNNELDPKELTKIATQVGLSSTAFDTCLESGQYAPRVNLDVQNAQELGALGTPYSILIDTKTGDHYPLEGAYPYSQLKQAIDLILQS